MSEIIIAEQSTYEYAELSAKIFRMLDDLGLRQKIRPEDRVFLKVNLLSKKRPEDAVTTHPSVVRAVAEYVIASGAQPIIGDSPGGPFTEQALRGIYEATGMREVAERTGATLNYDTRGVEVRLTDYKALERIEMVQAILDADLVINLAKLKTHVMMTYTGAVKNLFGTVPGLTKASYHMKLQEPQLFANHLIDICEKIKPIISLIDGIEAMEGDGPSNGEKRALGFLLTGTNPYELDYYACVLAGIDPEKVATLVEARKRDKMNLERAEVRLCDRLFNDREAKEEIARLNLAPFKLPKPQSVNFLHGRVPAFMENFLVRQTKSKPIFIRKKCIGCRKCERSCPAKIIAVKDGKAGAALQNCISCFCCHELCPVDAIRIKTPLLAKLIFRNEEKK